MTTQNTQQQQMIYLSNARWSFPWIVDPQVKKNDKGVDVAAYNCDLILPPNDPAFQKFMQMYAALAQEKWKEHAQAAMQSIQGDRKNRCFGAGEERTNKKTFQPYDGYVGHVYLSARSTRQPQIIRPDGTPVDPANTMEIRGVASKLYAGCYVNAVVKPWLQQNSNGIGCRCDLIAIQFAKDGDPFGSGAPDASAMFGASATPAAAPVLGAAPVMPAAPFPGAAVPGIP